MHVTRARVPRLREYRLSDRSLKLLTLPQAGERIE